MRDRIVATGVVLLLAAVSAASAQFGPPPARGPVGRTATAPHVKVQLIASPRTGPGGRLWLGVRFDLEPQWHLYWRNPGEGGSPPEVQWTTPPYVQAGAFEWPVPERIDAGGVVSYGYHGTVVLPVPMTVAADAVAKGTVSASLRWMVCKDMCVPGVATLELTLPLAGSDLADARGWDTEIAQGRTLVPLVAPAAWTIRARATRDAFDVTVVTGRREAEAVFFPLETNQVNDAAPQQMTPMPDGLRLVLKKSDQLATDPPQLRGVLALVGGRAFVVTAPLTR